jgi:hypothetical protein
VIGQDDLHAGPDDEQHEDHVEEVLELQPPGKALVDRRGGLGKTNTPAPIGIPHSTLIQRRPHPRRYSLLGRQPVAQDETIVRAAQRRFQRISGRDVLRAFGHRLFVSVDRRRLAMSSVVQPREGRAPVHSDVIGLAALDLVLRRLRARVMFIALVVDVFRMNPR